MTTSQALNGKICLVTGATSGIGLATAEALARMGVHVVGVGRNQDKCAATASRIKQESGNQSVDFLVADLSSQRDIRRLADEVRNTYGRVDVLVNNAGGYYSKRQESPDGIELTLALNHLGYFLLTNLLLGVLTSSAPSRVVNVSSARHGDIALNFNDLQMTNKYSGGAAYDHSKLCNLLFTYELARRLAGTGVTVNAVAPGLVRTNLGLQNGGMDSLQKRFANRLPFAVGPEKGAETVVYLASSPDVEDVTGKYFARMKQAESSPESQDRAAAERLWKLSEEMTGLAKPV